MKLEQQVVSLELAKRLKELGVKQDSLYWWSDHTAPATLWNENALMEATVPDIAISDVIYAAFTVAELGEMLTYSEHPIVSYWSFDEWICCDHPMSIPFSRSTISEANARAKMLIYLLENKRITLS